MTSEIITIDDLMRATYEGNYAMAFLGMIGGLKAIPAAKGYDIKSPAFAGLGNQVAEELKKADDPFLTSKTNYFNPIYGQSVFDWLNHEADIWKLLPKDTYASKGDSFRVVEADATNFWGQLETASAMGDTDIPTLREITVDDPAVMYNHWDASFMGQIKSTWQDTPKKNVGEFFKEYFAKKHPSDLNVKLCQETGTLAKLGGSFDNYIESIDRVCSDGAEEALLDAGDCDIYGLNRSGNEGEAYNDINGGTLRDLDLGLLDDMIADCKKYSDNKRFILLTDEVQLNTLEALEAVKYRYGEANPYKISAINGVNTRNGVTAGFSIATYRGAGLEIPIFTSKDVHAETSGNGNLYLLDLDHISIRVALPTVYMNTENAHFLLLDQFQYKYMYLTVAQLVADQFNCHGAIKYLN